MTLRAAAVGAALVAVVLAAAGSSRGDRGFVVRRLVTDAQDGKLVNAWGLAASPTGPWWTANEARDASTLYSGDGRKQLLTVEVGGGPTGVVFNGGPGFRIASGRTSANTRSTEPMTLPMVCAGVAAALSRKWSGLRSPSSIWLR